MEEKKSKKNLIIVIVILALICIGIGCYIGRDSFFNKKQENNNNTKIEEKKSNIFFTIDGVEVNFPCTLKEIIEKTGYNISMINDDYRNLNFGIKDDALANKTSSVCLAKEDKWFEVQLAANKNLRMIDEQVIGFTSINDNEHFPTIKLMDKWGVGDSATVDEIKSIITTETPTVEDSLNLTYMNKTFDFFSITWKEDKNIISEISYRIPANYDNYTIPTYKENNALDNVQITLDGNKLNLPVDLNNYGTNTDLYVDKHISRYDLDNGMTYAFDLTYQTSSTMLFNGWKMDNKLYYDDIVKAFGEPFSVWKYDLTGKTFTNEEKDICIVYVTEKGYLSIITRNDGLSFLSYSKI